MSREIATTILAQLGGNRFRAMTGAKDFVALENGLRMRFPAGFAKDRINMLMVTLRGDDTYSLETGALARLKYREVERVEGIYVDMLHSEVERMTGLATRL